MKRLTGSGLAVLVILFMVLFFSGLAWPDTSGAGNISNNSSATPSGGVNESAVASPAENNSATRACNADSTAFKDPELEKISSLALGFGEHIRYDEDTMTKYPPGDERNDISLSIKGIISMYRLYIKDIYSGYEYTVFPDDGFRFFLVSVTAAPVGEYLERYISPMTRDFIILDPSGTYNPLLLISESAGVEIRNETTWDTMVNERFVIRNVGEIYVGETIFSSLNNVAGSGSISGWIIYEVPDSFSPSAETFIQLTLADEKVYWKLHDILINLKVKKNYDTGGIRISYNGGPESYLVRGIEAELVMSDGSVQVKSVDKGDDEESLSETEIWFAGTAGDGDMLEVKVIRLDGEEFVKFQKIV
ncbi:MAG: hypothetical protein JW931_05555 [Methanomicrobiaceae archaeon]|nr:hypothetical protein [Methanomicrobiaceae archaeon]